MRSQVRRHLRLLSDSNALVETLTAKHPITPATHIYTIWSYLDPELSVCMLVAHAKDATWGVTLKTQCSGLPQIVPHDATVLSRRSDQTTRAREADHPIPGYIITSSHYHLHHFGLILTVPYGSRLLHSASVLTTCFLFTTFLAGFLVRSNFLFPPRHPTV